MGLFSSKSDRQIEQLTKALLPPLNSIVLAAAGLTSLDDLRSTLGQHRAEIARLKSGLSVEQLAHAYETYWRGEWRVFTAVFEAGHTTVETVQRLHREWIDRLTLAVLETHASQVRVPAPGRPWSFDQSSTEFTYVERVLPHLPDELDNYAGIVSISAEVERLRGTVPFAGVLYGSQLQPIGPEWVSVRDAAAHRDGQIVASGWPTHRVMDLPDALDLGAYDGRNLFAWGCGAPSGLQSPNDNLYVGSSPGRYFEMSCIGGSISALDMAADGRSVTVLEHWGGGGWNLAIADIASGARRYLGSPGDLTGFETVHTSPDGTWILIAGHRQLVLVSASNGGLIRLDVDGLLSASWWPAHSASTIALLINHEDGVHLGSFDCAAPSVVDLGPILGPATDLDRDRRLYTELRVHPSRNLALVGAPEGPSNDHQRQHGTRHRVAMLDLDSRRFHVLVDPFLDAHGRYERDQRRWNWTARVGDASRPVVMHDSLLDAARSPIGPHQPNDTSFAGSDAHDLTVFLMKAMSDHMDDVHRLRPEALRAYEAARRFGRAADLDEWLVLLSRANHEVLADAARQLSTDRSQWPAEVLALAAFSSSLDHISAGRYDRVDWSADRTA